MKYSDSNNTAANVGLHGNFDPPQLQQFEHRKRFEHRSKDNPCCFYSSAVTVTKRRENHGSLWMLKEYTSDWSSLEICPGHKKQKSYPSKN